MQTRLQPLYLDKDLALDLVEVGGSELGIASVLWDFDEETFPDLAHNVDHDLLLFVVGVDLEADNDGQAVGDKGRVTDSLADLAEAAGRSECVSMLDDGFDNSSCAGFALRLGVRWTGL